MKTRRRFSELVRSQRFGIGYYLLIQEHRVRGFSRNYDANNPFVAMPILVYEDLPRICRFLGLAILTTPEKTFVLGREYPVARLVEDSPLTAGMLETSFMADWYGFRPESAQKELEKARRQIVSIPKLEVFIHQNWPELTVWNGSLRKLAPVAPGLALNMPDSSL